MSNALRNMTTPRHPFVMTQAQLYHERILTWIGRQEAPVSLLTISTKTGVSQKMTRRTLMALVEEQRISVVGRNASGKMYKIRSM
jgi:hypothetical protein